MPLPASIRVKLSSEAAEYVALTPVVVREIPLAEIVEYIVSVTGPDATRVTEILRRGSLVSGATRFRWDRLEADATDLEQMLLRLPQSDPSREFDEARCAWVWLCGPESRIQITRESALRTKLLRRAAFWPALLNAIGAPEYVSYLYRERADLFRGTVTPDVGARIAEAARLLPFADLSAQIRGARLTSVEFLVRRAGS